MNWLDRGIASVAPTWAARRAQSRSILAAYEAAQSTKLRRQRTSNESGNGAVMMAGGRLRDQARWLDENHDLARGVLNTLVNGAVGATGIGIEPAPRNKGKGDINDDLKWALLKAHREWSQNPEVTGQFDAAGMDRLMCRSWLRDGEAFGQHVIGTWDTAPHLTSIPYSVEMLEADFVPLDMTEPPRVYQGVEINAWQRPVGYHVYKTHPRDILSYTDSATKRIPAERMIHLKLADRIGQLRGVSIFASGLGRLEDIKDYEDSERVAAKIAANFAAMIRKGDPGMYDPGRADEDRTMPMRPGMIFDDLRPGESVEMIDTKRPNTMLVEFRKGQLRALSAGTGASYSSVARDYDGSYSSQRQELVENWVAYSALAQAFIAQVKVKQYRQFVEAVRLSGKVKIPRSVDLATIYDALYIPPQMPWIDPRKEVEAYALMEDRTYMSGPEIVRRFGGQPNDVIDTQERWLADKKAAGIELPNEKLSNEPNPVTE